MSISAAYWVPAADGCASRRWNECACACYSSENDSSSEHVLRGCGDVTFKSLMRVYQQLTVTLCLHIPIVIAPFQCWILFLILYHPCFNNKNLKCAKFYDIFGVIHNSGIALYGLMWRTKRVMCHGITTSQPVSNISDHLILSSQDM